MRAMITRFIGAFVVLGLVLVVLAGCATPKEKPPTITSGIVDIGKVADYPAGKVSTKYYDRYGIKIAKDAGEVLVVRPLCPVDHKVTRWKPHLNVYVCGIDHSHFDILGRVVRGPAKTNLPAVRAITHPDGTLTVNLDQLYQGLPPQK